MRRIVLDTETTGLDWEQGHRVIEIGCVEILDRRRTANVFHCYLNPERQIDQAAQDVHGLSLEMLADKPRFAEVCADLLAYLGDAELIIHNASFDLGFLDNELRLSGHPRLLAQSNAVLDTLTLARQLNPGQRNSLDALCKRYSVDNSRRDLHGALLDAELLADVYLAMTGGQAKLSLGESDGAHGSAGGGKTRRLDSHDWHLVTPALTPSELEAHEAYLDMLDDACKGISVWRRVGIGRVAGLRESD